MLFLYGKLYHVTIIDTLQASATIVMHGFFFFFWEFSERYLCVNIKSQSYLRVKDRSLKSIQLFLLLPTTVLLCSILMPLIFQCSRYGGFPTQAVPSNQQQTRSLIRSMLPFTFVTNDVSGHQVFMMPHCFVFPDLYKVFRKLLTLNQNQSFHKLD